MFRFLFLVGNSGSGKTALGLELCKKYPDKFKWISSYTTRPMREGEVNGVDHIFVDKSVFCAKDYVAYTFFGGHHYWTTTNQFDTDKINVYVIDELGVKDMINKFGDKFTYTAVYIQRTNTDVDKDRTDRDKNRQQLPDSFYQMIIYNNYKSVDDFIKESIKNIIELL